MSSNTTYIQAKPSLFTWLRQPVDNAPLVVFRWCFGLLLFLESGGAILTGWVKKALVEPAVHFPFIGFEWLKPLPGNGMYFYYGVMAVLGLLVMVGLFYRASITAFTLLWWGAYLMQKASYNNHYYLLLVLCFLMMLVPAHAYASLDAKRRPELRSPSCPRWCLLIFVVQMAIVYTYAALAKIEADWLAGIPINMWFANKSHFYLIGGLLQEACFQKLVVYGGIFFDLLIVPLLLWRPTRKWAFILAIFFHGFNSAVFHIGIFPYLALALCLFFFPPETIRRKLLPRKPAFAPDAPVCSTHGLRTREKALFLLLGLHFLVQIALPLRHWWFPGNANWTEEGHRMAWHMMLRSKSGYAQYRVVADGQVFWEYPQQHLTPKQARMVATHPDLIWQYSQFLKNKYQTLGYSQVKVFAHTQVSLNRRPHQLLVDSTVNLAAVPWSPHRPSPWVLPLQEDKSPATPEGTKEGARGSFE
ncbi:HTTM domain-containing protein [Rufibacter glacialis]|uniref:HTTM domain-containing protein n=1 Tax=Rufibacter glacialis TaxID=1259555 RepID=A0A5M8QEZ8_9BACT|nr:HTTM domain-containing protein [Rufibacter glacialis]KAA6433544.1 HTTM domain-containing protein [Rufibacter glacialis]GGK73192.1 type I deoxyribonuclease HsdR [Rufibacter glacialis]